MISDELREYAIAKMNKVNGASVSADGDMVFIHTKKAEAECKRIAKYYCFDLVLYMPGDRETDKAAEFELR